MKLVAKSPGAAAIIGYGDEGGEISEVQEFPGVWKRRAHKALQAGQQGGKPRPAANGKNPQAVDHEAARGAGDVGQRRVFTPLSEESFCSPLEPLHRGAARAPGKRRARAVKDRVLGS